MNYKNVHIKLTLWTLSVLLITISPSVSGQATWTSSGPPGGYVNSISFSPSDQGVVYAGTISGVYKSTDDGETWSFAGLSGIKVNTVKADPEDSQLIYAGTDIENGFFKSFNGGEDWIQQAVGKVLTMDIDPNDPKVLWVGTDSGKIFKSSDQGDIWTEMHHEERTGRGYPWDYDIPVHSIKVDPENSSTIFAGFGENHFRTTEKGFAKSVDGGETWKFQKVGRLSTDNTLSLVITPQAHTPQTLYIIATGGSQVSHEDDVYFSTDKGETWTAGNVPVIGKTGTNRYSSKIITVDISNNNLIYIGTSNPEYPLIAVNTEMYPDINWILDIGNSLPESAPTCLAVNPFEPDEVLAGYFEGTLYKSTDNAKNWDKAATGINNSVIKDMAVHPQLSESVYAVLDGYLPVQKTNNGGVIWDAYSPELSEYFSAIAIDPKKPDRMFAGTSYSSYVGRIYRSLDGGMSGDMVDSNSFSGPVRGLWIHPDNPDTVFALKRYRKSGISYYYGGVRRSTDGGDTWDQVYNWDWPKCMAFDPNDKNIVYLGLQSLGYVIRSSDAGMTWTNISPKQEWVYSVFDMVVDSNSDIFVATTDFEQNATRGIWKWNQTDWTHLYRFGDSRVNSLAIDKRTNPGTLYAGTNGEGVFVSRDGGESWTPFNDGLEMMDIVRLEISQSEPYILYAGTNYGGIWSIPLEIMTYSITAQAAENGSISPIDEVTVEYGDDQIFDIVPDEGFRVAYIRIDGNEINLETDENWDAGSGQYTFSNVTEAHTIEVGFEVATALAEAKALQQLTVYPNPAKDELWVEFYHHGDAAVDLVLLNIHGQVVQQVSVSASGPVRRRMATHDLTPGVYLLTISGEEAFPVKKVVVEN